MVGTLNLLVFIYFVTSAFLLFSVHLGLLSRNVNSVCLESPHRVG
jgi:hypothetical protein